MPNPQPTCKRVRFHGSVFRQVGIDFEWSWNPPKTFENQWDLAHSVQDSVRSSWVWQRFRRIQWFFPQITPRIAGFGVTMPNQIVLITKIRQIKLKNSLESLGIHQILMVFRWVGFHGFWRRGLKTDPPASSFGA